jgi:hypothetical protein
MGPLFAARIVTLIAPKPHVRPMKTSGYGWWDACS